MNNKDLKVICFECGKLLHFEYYEHKNKIEIVVEACKHCKEQYEKNLKHRKD